MHAPEERGTGFDAAGYWEDRLSREPSLRGTAHISYSRASFEMERRGAEVVAIDLDSI